MIRSRPPEPHSNSISWRLSLSAKRWRTARFCGIRKPERIGSGRNKTKQDNMAKLQSGQLIKPGTIFCHRYQINSRIKHIMRRAIARPCANIGSDAKPSLRLHAILALSTPSHTQEHRPQNWLLNHFLNSQTNFIGIDVHKADAADTACHYTIGHNTNVRLFHQG